MKEETKQQVKSVLGVVYKYYFGYITGFIVGFALLLQLRDFGQRPISTIFSVIFICAIVFINIENFKKDRETRYGFLMGGCYTGVLVPIFGLFYSDAHFMFGYSFMQVVLTLTYEILRVISFWYHIKMFEVKITNVKLKKWMLLILFIIISSNLVGLIKFLISGGTSTIFGAG